jgi:hypothetical protein
MMWVLLHYTRLLTILKRAADRPIGFVASAVMLNAKLRKGMTLMHVIAMTRSLGCAAEPERRATRVLPVDRWRRLAGHLRVPGRQAGGMDPASPESGARPGTR